jgi:putative ATP-dependent endonuclease of OLD family
MRVCHLRLKDFQSFGPEPPNFSHMAIETEDGVPQVRVRLTAVLAADGEIDEKIEYVLVVDEDDQPTSCADMSRYDRGHIEVHYLPARRDPAEHISYTTASLIARTLRAADWSSERDSLDDLMVEVTDVLVGNAAVARIGTQLAEEWSGLHTGAFFTTHPSPSDAANLRGFFAD